MKTLTSFLLFAVLTASPIAETLRDEYSDKSQALRGLGEQSRAAVNPSGSIVFPQVANGFGQGIIIVTSIVLSNNTGDPLTVSLTFRNEFGGTMSLSLFNSSTGGLVVSGSSVTVIIPPFETLFLETDGSGSLVEGWGRAVSSGSSDMGGVAAFQLIDASTLGFLTVVGVGASDATPGFFTPIFKDSSLNSNTALAIANTSNATAFIRVFLFENNGDSDVATITIGAQRSSTFFIDELFPAIGTRFFGTAHFIRVDGAGQVSVQFDVHPTVLLLSNGILSSLPVTNIVPL